MYIVFSLKELHIVQLREKPSLILILCRYIGYRTQRNLLASNSMRI